MLASMLVAWATTFAAAVAVACTRMPRRWLWLIIALLGVSRFSLDWATGVYQWLPFQVVLFSAGFFRAGVAGSWLMSVALPIGALLALQRVRAHRRAQVAPITTAARDAVA